MSENNSKNQNKAYLDLGQMYNAVFDGKNESFRVSIVDGVELNVENLSIPELKLPEMKPILIPDIKEIKVPEIIREVQIERIEIPVIIKEPQIQTIEKPIYITEIKVIEIEKPIIIKEKEIQVIENKTYEIPMIAKVCMIAQTIALLGLLLTNAL